MIRRPPRSTLFPLHDALPIYSRPRGPRRRPRTAGGTEPPPTRRTTRSGDPGPRSEEHTSELQSQSNLVCRLLLEKKNNDTHTTYIEHDDHLQPSMSI